jgi:WD40 repeat protein
VTGCVDSSVRVWYWKDLSVELRATLCGHEGSQVKCIDVSTEFGTIVTGCDHGRVLLWDLRTLTFVRQLRYDTDDKPSDSLWSGKAVVSLSTNHSNGNIVAVVGCKLTVFDINGNPLAFHFFEKDPPTCTISADCPEWMEQGVAVITGHGNGEVRLWGLDYDSQELFVRHQLMENPHRCDVTALRVTGVERQDTLLVGDRSGLMSAWKTLTLDTFSSEELSAVVVELQTGLRQENKTLGFKSQHST